MFGYIEIIFFRFSGFIVYGMCYPESLRASTSCEQVFENVDSASMSKTMGDVKIKNCRLSFCEDDLCNDPNGSSLPVHVPTEKRPCKNCNCK